MSKLKDYYPENFQTMSEDSKKLIKRGLYIYTLFNQETVWFDRGLEQRLIAELDSRYASNICRFLLRRQERLFWAYGLGEALVQGKRAEVIGEPDDFDIPSVLDPLDSRDDTPEIAERWLRGSRLFKALEQQAQVRVVI